MSNKVKKHQGACLGSLNFETPGAQADAQESRMGQLLRAYRTGHRKGVLLGLIFGNALSIVIATIIFLVLIYAV